MHVPSVRPNESENDYVSRCITVVMGEGTAQDSAQAAAICHSMYRDHKKAQPNPIDEPKLANMRKLGLIP